MASRRRDQRRRQTGRASPQAKRSSGDVPAPAAAAKAPRQTSFKALSAAGVLAAVLLGVIANVLAARFYERWDWTARGLYTLSPATVETLQGLESPVKVVVFLSASDPLTITVRHMLTAYGTETRRLETRWVDPDRNPAEFLALQQEYGILAGKTEDGRVVTDAMMVIVRGDKRWYITADDVVSVDEGQAKPRLEQALTEGIRNVLASDTVRLCFTLGHQEVSIDDGGPNGLGELRFRLQKNNYDVVSFDFSAPKQEVDLAECRVLVIAGPEVRFEARDSERLRKYFEGGGNVLLMVNPILDDDNRITGTGLESLTRAADMEPNADFVVEGDQNMRLPTGLGETFLATPKEHDVTRGLLSGGETRFRVLLSAAQSLRSTGGRSVPLLTTSAKSFAIKDVRPFIEQGKAPDAAGAQAGPFTVAMAAELAKADGQAHGPRMVVVGSANLAWSRNFRDPTLLGNRLFLESAISWLAARPALVSVPEKASFDVGLSLTEDSLSDVRNYVLIYMPLAAAALGLFVLLRRRAGERRSRRGKTDAEAA